MRFLVLGPVQGAADGKPVDFGRGHRRTILAVLLAADGEVVTTDRLIAALWGADVPATARKSLQSHVSRLRSQLDDLAPGDPDPLVSTSDGYRVDLSAHPLDAREFRDWLAAAREVSGHDPAAAVSRFQSALDLWRGPAYGKLADHGLIRPEAVRLEQLRRSAVLDLIDARLRLGHHHDVLGVLEQTVLDDPLGERAHRQLMVALYRSGRQGDALRAYRALQERLRDELGVDPAPKTQELHEQLLRQDPALAAPPGPGRSSTTVTLSTSDLLATTPGVPPPSLIGRDRDVAEVEVRVAPRALVTLTGPGGVGKTRLAEEVVARVGDRFDDGTIEVPLAVVRDPDSVGEALVTAFGIQPTGEHAAVDALIAALGDRRMLLLLDNCEHLLEAVVPIVRAVLSRCPNVAILATSRERLGVPGERLWAVPPLPVPRGSAGPDEVAETPAGALFRLRAEESDPRFELTDDNAGAVGELCRRLDGMPLAIELAAARARALSPQDLVARLDQRFALLAGGPRHESGRHRTLQAVVAWSYDLLRPAEARLFDRLSVFAGSFTLDAAERVCAGGDIGRGDVAALMAELVDKSMVVTDRSHGESRYRLLDTLREFGARRLADEDDLDRWQQAHADHHVEVAEELGPRVRGPEEPEAVVAIDAVFDDLRSAHLWFVARQDAGPAMRIPAAIADYLFYRLRDEVTTWAQRAVALPDAELDASYGAALATSAFGATSRADCDLARRQAEQALAHASADSVTSVRGVAALGVAALYEGRLEELLTYAERLTTLADRLGMPFYAAFAGVMRVIGHAYRDEHEEALASLPALEAAADASGSPTMRAFARYSRGEALLDASPVEAAAALQEAVDAARAVDNALVYGVSLVSLASLRGRLGHVDEALRQYREVVAHWRRLGDHTHQLTTLRNLVVLLADIGADKTAAILDGAVSTEATPSFGREQERLRAARERVASRLGPTATEVAMERGRQLTPTQMAEVALRHLDQLIEP